MRNAFLVSALLFLLSCQTDQQTARREIRHMEQQRTDSLNDDLVQSYLTYTEHFPDDTVWVSRYLLRAAQLAYQQLNYAEAISLLYRGLRDYYSGPQSPQQVALLYQLYEQEVRTPFLTHTLVQAARRSFPQVSETWPLPGDLPNLEKRLQARREQVYEEAARQINYPSANEFVTAAELYALLLPEAEKSPDFLLSAAEITRGLGVYRRALGLLDWVGQRYADRPQGAQASFLKAFTLDEQMRDTLKARAAYTFFLERYPDHDFADDAQLLLEALQ